MGTEIELKIVGYIDFATISDWMSDESLVQHDIEQFYTEDGRYRLVTNPFNIAEVTCFHTKKTVLGQTIEGVDIIQEDESEISQQAYYEAAYRGDWALQKHRIMMNIHGFDTSIDVLWNTTPCINVNGKRYRAVIIEVEAADPEQLTDIYNHWITDTLQVKVPVELQDVLVQAVYIDAENKSMGSNYDLWKHYCSLDGAGRSKRQRISLAGSRLARQPHEYLLGDNVQADETDSDAATDETVAPVVEITEPRLLHFDPMPQYVHIPIPRSLMDLRLPDPDQLADDIISVQPVITDVPLLPPVDNTVPTTEIFDSLVRIRADIITYLELRGVTEHAAQLGINPASRIDDAMADIMSIFAAPRQPSEST